MTFPTPRLPPLRQIDRTALPRAAAVHLRAMAEWAAEVAGRAVTLTSREPEPARRMGSVLALLEDAGL